MLELTSHFNKYLVTQSTQSNLVTQSKRRVRGIDLLVRVYIAKFKLRVQIEHNRDRNLWFLPPLAYDYRLLQ